LTAIFFAGFSFHVEPHTTPFSLASQIARHWQVFTTTRPFSSFARPPLFLFMPVILHYFHFARGRFQLLRLCQVFTLACRY
jgi:hypothetical protein